MKIRLNESDYRCGLIECYENIAIRAGYTPTQHTLYDCRRVCVSKALKVLGYSTNIKKNGKGLFLVPLRKEEQVPP